MGLLLCIPFTPVISVLVDVNMDVNNTNPQQHQKRQVCTIQYIINTKAASTPATATAGISTTELKPTTEETTTTVETPGTEGI